MRLQNDPLRDYYPHAIEALGKAPHYCQYLTYDEFVAMVAKHKNEWGYFGKYTDVLEPEGYASIGNIHILMHQTPTNPAPEFQVNFQSSAFTKRDKYKWCRPQQTEWTTDLNEAYAMYIAIAYPNLEMWETILTCPDQAEAAKNKYLLPNATKYTTFTHIHFTAEEKKQFIKNLGGV